MRADRGLPRLKPDPATVFCLAEGLAPGTRPAVSSRAADATRGEFDRTDKTPRADEIDFTCFSMSC